jgi:5-dehydro-2-deoxygluconokinase
MTADTFEVVTMGRVGIDVYPDDVGVALEDVQTFRTYLGGSPTNVAVAAARHGRRTAVITRVGDDPFGRLVRREFRRYDIDDRFLAEVRGRQTPVTFCEMFPPDEFPIYFYRPDAPDLTLRAEDLDLRAIRSADVFWATLTGLSDEPSRTATFAALEARAGRPFTILDLDLRPSLWPSREEAQHQARAAMRFADVVVGNLDEFEAAVGTRDPESAALAARDLGAGLVIVKRGGDGVTGLDADGVVDVPAVAVTVVNGLGAGDAFGGALCHGMLSGWPLRRTLSFANAAGALVASRIACSAAMPRTDEVEKLLGEESDGR